MDMSLQIAFSPITGLCFSVLVIITCKLALLSFIVVFVAGVYCKDDIRWPLAG